MATFILKWNPAISSFTSEDFALFRKQLPRNRDLNWSVWDYREDCINELIKASK
jgi:hypothetical protein